MKMKKLFLIMFIAVFVSMAGKASAVMIDLDYSNTGVLGTFATVELTQDSSNLQTFHFDVTTKSGFLMRNFYFNTDITGLTTANITNISSASPAYSPVVSYDSISGTGGFGKYDISIQKTGEHNVSELTFDLINVGLAKTVDDFIQLAHSPAGNGYGHFAAQIIGDPTAPTFFARDGDPSSVPEPATLLFFVTGLLGLGFFRFRK